MPLNLAGLLFETAARFPGKTALYWRDERWTYRELAEQVQTLSGALSGLGVASGERVGLLLYNQPSFVISYFALLSLGAVVIPLNTRLTGTELDVILHDSGARWMVSSLDFQDTLENLDSPNLRGMILDRAIESKGSWDLPASLSEKYSCHSWDTLIQSLGADENTQPKPVDDKTLATLIYTSGTTGIPKGVMLSHHNILSDAQANAQVIEAVPEDVFITISPLFHVFGQTNVLMTAVLVGGSIVLIKKFSPKTVLEAIEQYQVTFMAAVPTMYQMMLSCIREGRYDLSSLRVCHSGAAPMPQEVFHQVEAVFGAPVQEGYGLSEASSIITSNPLHGPRKPGSVGLPLSGLDVRVFQDSEMGDGDVECAAGEIGEIRVRGPVLMQGYYQRPEETEKVLVNGWLRTKDLAYRDEDGYIFIVDRMDDLINIGGVKVYPREIEEVLYRHPMVASVAVIGTPASIHYQTVKAYVVLKPNEVCSKEDLQTFCQPYLADYKIPKIVEFVDEIPQSATGKILRKELRALSG